MLYKENHETQKMKVFKLLIFVFIDLVIHNEMSLFSNICNLSNTSRRIIASRMLVSSIVFVEKVHYDEG